MPTRRLPAAAAAVEEAAPASTSEVQKKLLPDFVAVVVLVIWLIATAVILHGFLRILPPSFVSTLAAATSYPFRLVMAVGK